MFTMRFDMRTPASGAPTPALYDAALEMCAWAETRGAIMAVFSEHHATADGHLPSPLMLASAIAARTKVLNILVAAAVLPLYHPVRLAEDMTVLDNLSKGRVHYVFGIGHRPEEYEHMGVDARRRGKIADESLAAAPATARAATLSSSTGGESTSRRHRATARRSAHHDRRR